MKRTAKLNKSYSETKNTLIKKNQDKITELKNEIYHLEKEIAYEEMKEATGTKNKQTLIQLINKRYSTNLNELGQEITAGGAIIGE